MRGSRATGRAPGRAAGRAAAAALATALAVVVAGCASAPPPAGVAVRLEQSRDNENRHLLQVVLTNDGDAPFEVARLQLRSSGYGEVPPTVRSDVVRPGLRTAFPVEYGRADCRRDAPGPTSVVVGRRTADGLVDVRLPVPDDDPLLPRLHRRECDLVRLAEAVQVGFAPGWRRVGDTAEGELVLRRAPGAPPVELQTLEGTVLLTLRTPTELPLSLEAPRTVVPVVVTVSRCDVHALVESKRSLDVPWVSSLDGAEPLTSTVRPGPAGRALLQELIGDVCAPG